ncbi:hypothetical protein KAR91_17950 [Candidatus Pacearchaeota archaeon]|nr:hypothetical protein [Candidatus Pacearchaeota archaeon]
MGKIVLKQEFKTIQVGDQTQKIKLLENEKFDSFNPSLLGLGDISTPSKGVEAIAAIFDLSGFTKFCRQVDPQLAVPEYLSQFLDWLFNEIKTEFVSKSYHEGKALYSELPFLAKFLGDGVLFLWNTEDMGGTEICNIVTSLHIICNDYSAKFYPKIRGVVVDPPHGLRCGIARGRVFSVGNGEDYVGPCINIAARLQKLSNLTFCFPRRGFDIDKYIHKVRRPLYVEKCITISGIGENELVWVIKEELENLPEDERKLFRKP